jgi:hypothetical protein
VRFSASELYRRVFGPPDGSRTAYRVVAGGAFWAYDPEDEAHHAATAQGGLGPELKIAYAFETVRQVARR